MFDEFFVNISNTSFEDFVVTSQEAIEKITASPELMCKMLENIKVDPVLAYKTECYDFLDKMVVYSNDDLGIFARISCFHAGYGERIHYHRWNYSSKIIKGSYTQKFYGTIEEKKKLSVVDNTSCIFMEQLNQGNIYSLENSVIHSIQVQPDTISFCIRGKALRDRFQVKDANSNTIWWQYGQALEAAEERSVKRMPEYLLDSKISEITNMILNQSY